MKPVVVLGDLVVDHIIQVGSLPITAGAHQRVYDAHPEPGGAGNTLIAGARLGLPMTSFGAVGDDGPGHFLIETLSNEGVDASGIMRIAGESTRVVYLIIAKDGQHVFLGYRGLTGPTELPRHWSKTIANASVLFFDGWAYIKDDPQMLLQAATVAAENGVPLLFDPGPIYADIGSEWLTRILQQTHTLLLTHDEAQGLLNSAANALDIGRQLLDRGPQQVIIKQGAEGLTLVTRENYSAVAGLNVTVRDTTGAGDVMVAAAIYALLLDFNMEHTAIFCNAAGAATVQKVGTGTQVPTREEIIQLLPTGKWFG